MNIDEFGAYVDRWMEKHDVELLIKLPKGSMEVEFSGTVPSPIFSFYVLLNAMKKTLEDMLCMDILDEDKKEMFLDGCLELIRCEIWDKEAADEDITD